MTKVLPFTEVLVLQELADMMAEVVDELNAMPSSGSSKTRHKAKELLLQARSFLRIAYIQEHSADGHMPSEAEAVLEELAEEDRLNSNGDKPDIGDELPF